MTQDVEGNTLQANLQEGQQATMHRLWSAHRANAGTFRVLTVLDGLLVADMTREPPRVWAARIQNGTLRVRTAGIPGVFAPGDGPLSVPEALFARMWAGDGIAVRDLPPPQAAALMGVVPGEESWAELSVRRFSEGIADPILRARLPMQKMAADEGKRLGKAGLEALLVELDPEAMQMLACVEDYSWRDYAYYAIKGQEGSLDAAHRMVRHQAARSYPMLAGFIASRFGVKADLGKQAEFLLARAPIKQALDAAKAAGDLDAEARAKASMEALPKPHPLIDSIERAFTPPPTPDEVAPKPIVSRAALARIGGIAMLPRGLKAEYVAKCMSELPVDWFPKKGADWKPDEWEAFTDLISTVGVVLRRITKSTPEVLYEGCGGKWVALRDRMVKGFTDTRSPGGMTGEEVKTLEASIDWASLKALPKAKVAAAAIEVCNLLASTLPTVVHPDSVQQWIVRLVAPPSSRDTILHACNETDIAVELLSSKVLLPLAVSMTGDGNPMLGQAQFDRSRTVAASMLFGGKGAVKVFEAMAAFHQHGAAIQSGGSVLPHEMLEQKTAAQEDAIRIAKEAEDKEKTQALKLIGAAGMVGVDITAPHDFPIPFLPVVVAPNGVHLCTLFNWKMFQDEGRGFRGDQYGTQGQREEGTAYGYRKDTRNKDGSFSLNLCVGMYKFSYDGGRSGEFCISARVPGGDEAIHGAPYTRLSLNSLYTFHKNEKNEWSASSKENKGWMNCAAPELVVEAFQWFFKGINSGEIPHTLDDVTHHVQIHIAQVDRVEDICGYDWTQYPRIKAALMPWMSPNMPVMNKRTRLPIQYFARLPEVVGLADSISPGWRNKESMRSATWGTASYVEEVEDVVDGDMEASAALSP